jgi:hypothetical protein
LSDEPPFDDKDKRLALLGLLNEIPSVSLAPDAIDRRRSISLELLAMAGAVADLCRGLEWVIEEAKQATTSPA